MHGISVGKGNAYDTGAAFHLATMNHMHKNIKLDDYCVHYGSASWGGQLNKNKLSKE